MQHQSINLTLPTSWDKCSDSQAKIILKIIASGIASSQEELKIQIFLRLTGITPLTPPDDDGKILARIGGKVFMIYSVDIAYGATTLDWALKPPVFPWRPLRIDGRKPAPPTLDTISFGNYIAADNLYLAYISTQNKEHLLGIYRILIPARRPWGYSDWGLYAVFNWFSSFKSWIQNEFQDLFPQADISLGNNTSPKAIRDNINGMLRALTKGDITAEEKILKAPCMRALTELNALAKEYNEFQKLKNK